MPDGAELDSKLCLSFFMYKFIVSCYYWPTIEGGLRLRASIIKQLTADGLDYARLGRLTSLEKLASSIERRRLRRLKVKCEIELAATLSLLDSDVECSDSSLIFLGRTQGRGKDDQTHRPNRSLKDVLGLPLTEGFRERLLSAA